MKRKTGALFAAWMLVMISIVSYAGEAVWTEEQPAEAGMEVMAEAEPGTETAGEAVPEEEMPAPEEIFMPADQAELEEITVSEEITASEIPEMPEEVPAPEETAGPDTMDGAEEVPVSEGMPEAERTAEPEEFWMPAESATSEEETAEAAVSDLEDTELYGSEPDTGETAEAETEVVPDWEADPAEELTEMPEAEGTETEKETEAGEERAETESETDAGRNLMVQTIPAVIFTDASYSAFLQDGTEIFLSGMMPEGAAAKAFPVHVEIEEVEVLAAYDLAIYDMDNSEYQPENGSLEVSIVNEAIREALAEDTELTVFHMEDVNDMPEEVPVISAGEEAVLFSADSFSIYVVGENEDHEKTYTEPGSEEETAVYTVQFHRFVWDEPDDSDTVISTQKAAGSDTLEMPASPELPHHVFDGWYTQRQDKETGEQEGYPYDFSKTVRDNLDSWGNSAAEEGREIHLYSCYDPVFYVYYMKDAKDAEGNAVFHTDEYHEKNSFLNTAAAETLWNAAYGSASRALTGWTDADGNPAASGLVLTDDWTLYPAVQTVAWVYFVMGEEAGNAVAAEPVYLPADAAVIGDRFPPDPVCAGYTFGGWYTSREADAVRVERETDIRALKGADGTLTLYAQWQPEFVGYTVNIWRQKATDGQLGLDQKAVRAEESSEEYLRYYDFAESIHVEASESTPKSGDLPDADLLRAWTAYGTAADGSSGYYGFEYNRTRTENDLRNVTGMAADGSTILNVFYDRVTVTWRFYDHSSASGTVSGTLIGLYNTNVTPANGSAAAGTWSVWTDPGESSMWGYQYGSQIRCVEFETVFKLLGDPLSSQSPMEVDFWRNETGARSAVFYYYLEVTNAAVQTDEAGETAKEAAANGAAYIRTLNHTDYVYARKQTVYFETALAFHFDDKFPGYTAAGYSKNDADGFTACRENQDVAVESGDILYLYSSALDYTITLTSGTANVGFDENGAVIDCGSNAAYTFKYGADLSAAVFPAAGMLPSSLFGPKDMTDFYTFTGRWYEDAACTAPFVKPDTMPACSLAAYAEWTSRTVTVTFVSELESDLKEKLEEAYGEGAVSENDDGSYSVLLPVGGSLGSLGDLQNLTAKERGKYQHGGWKYPDTGRLFNFDARLYEDTEISAIWLPDLPACTLTYDINRAYMGDHGYTGRETYSDGVGHTADHAGEWLLEIEQAFPELAEAEGQTGRFICWNTRADGTGRSYYPADLFDFSDAAELAADGTVILYAVWAAELTASLTLDYNYPEGYSNPSADHNPEENTAVTVMNLEEILLGEASALTKTVITAGERTYKFIGWADRADAADALIGPEETVAVNGDSNILYAVWLEIPSPEKSVDIGSGTEVSVGDELVYTITCFNADSGAADITITDRLDAGVDFVSASEGGRYDASAHTVTWILENVEAGAEGSVELAVQVNQNALQTDEVTNTASVQTGSESAVDTNPVKNPVNDPEDPTKTVDADGDGRFEDNGAEVAAGDMLIYQITYKNGHSEPAAVRIADELDKGLDFIDASDGGRYDAEAHTVTWTLKDVAACTQGSVTLAVQVNEQAHREKKVDNTARVQLNDEKMIDTNPVKNRVADFEEETEPETEKEAEPPAEPDTEPETETETEAESGTEAETETESETGTETETETEPESETETEIIRQTEKKPAGSNTANTSGTAGTSGTPGTSGAARNSGSSGSTGPAVSSAAGSSGVKTEDATPFALYLLVLLIALGALAGGIFYRRNRKKEGRK